MENPHLPTSSNSSSGCWPKSLWCLNTCGGTRVPQVAPADPFPIVSIHDKKDPNTVQCQPTPPIRPPRKRAPSNGNVNHFYVPDENGDVNVSSPQDERNNTPSPGEIPFEDVDFQLQNSIFIEIDKERRLRVVHLQTSLPKDVHDLSPRNVSTSPGAGTSAQAISTSNNTHRKSGVDEEDEYWFSKWTRKPRFRSIFERNTIHGSTEDGEKDNNNSTEPGMLSKDFEIARTAAAAKRRAWAYNNGASSGHHESVVEHSTIVDNDEEEFNSIDICESTTRWTKNGTPKTEHKITREEDAKCSSGNVNSEKVVKLDKSPEAGISNMGFEEDEEESEIPNNAPAELTISETVQVSLPASSGSPSPNNKSPNADMSSPGRISEETEQPQSPEVEEENDPNPIGIEKKMPLIFFIHGISGSSEIWKSQMEFFHNLGYEIVAPDLLGHGFSTTPNNAKYYHFESIAQDLLNVYDYFVEEDRKVVLIGHGYGACLASVITRVRPKSCTVLISIAGGGPTPLINRSCCRGSLIPFYCKFFHTEKKKGRFDNPELRHVLPPGIRDYMLNGQIWSDGDSAFYRRLTVPTLLVYGMKDKVVNLVEECEMERTIPKSFLEIIDSAGHMVMIEESAKLNKMLGKFIQSWV